MSDFVLNLPLLFSVICAPIQERNLICVTMKDAAKDLHAGLQCHINLIDEDGIFTSPCCRSHVQTHKKSQHFSKEKVSNPNWSFLTSTFSAEPRSGRYPVLSPLRLENFCIERNCPNNDSSYIIPHFAHTMFLAWYHLYLFHKESSVIVWILG